jgi:serine/threonine protein kinase
MQKGRYEILGTLGCGATSRVDKARDTLIGRTVALKTLVHSFGAAPEQKQFLREAQIVGQLSHPSIVGLFDVGIEDTGMAYLVMEYVAGKTLQQVLSDTPIPWPRACAWAADLAGALGRAHHAGIIHGDVKPANILVTEDGNVKLGDFGIARFATQVSGSGQLMGTPAYLSPEQILGQPQNTRSDLFSLGIVLYQMITGVRPFDGSSVGAVCAQILSTEPVPPSQRNPAIPAALDHVIMRCLAKNPADRYPTGEALSASLYPLARNTAEPLPDTNMAWWARPVQPRDVWVCASVVLILASVVPASRALAARFRKPSTPTFAVLAPKPPESLLEHHPTEISLDFNALEQKPKLVTPVKHTRLASRIVRQPAPAPAPAAGTGRQDPSPMAPALPLVLPTLAPRVVENAELSIDIDTTVADGTLAIFADQELIVTTDLHLGIGGEPVHLEHALSPGPHQLRVALYRPDKSLQTQKEGLAEIHSDALNNLKIRVSRRSKLLVKHETFLEVTWPSAVSPQTQATKPPIAGVVSSFTK